MRPSTLILAVALIAPHAQATDTPFARTAVFRPQAEAAIAAEMRDLLAPWEREMATIKAAAAERAAACQGAGKAAARCRQNAKPKLPPRPTLPVAMATGPIDNGRVCYEIAARLEQEYRLRPGILQAIVHVESKGEVNVINWRGQDFHPATRNDAVRFVLAKMADGDSIIDVGCSQIDAYYHPGAWSGPQGEDTALLDRLFDPEVNLRYAAQWLRKHFDEDGSRDWVRVAGHWHSHDPDRHREYAARLAAYLASFKAPAAPKRLLTAKTPAGTEIVAAIHDRHTPMPADMPGVLQARWEGAVQASASQFSGPVTARSAKPSRRSIVAQVDGGAAGRNAFAPWLE